MTRILRVRLPEEVELHARRTVDGCVEFTYTERSVDTEALRNASDAIKTLHANQGVTVEQKDEHSVTLTGTVPRHQFGDMMAGEFLGWSSLNDLTLGELLGNAVMVLSADANRKAEKFEPVPEPSPAPVFQPPSPPPLEERPDSTDPDRCVGYVVNEHDTHLYQCCNNGTKRDDGYHWCDDCHAKQETPCET